MRSSRSANPCHPEGLQIGVGRTVDYLSFHASLRPDDHALVDLDRPYSFSELWGMTCRAATALGAYELPQGALVCVEWTGFAQHLSILLALESLGLASASFLPKAPLSDRQEMLSHADFVLFDQLDPGEASSALRIDAGWWEGLEESARLPQTEVAPHALFRLVTSSGTTGAPKVIATSLAQTERRLQMIEWMVGYAQSSQLAFNMPFTFQGAHHQVLSCLRAGGVSNFIRGNTLWQTIGDCGASHAIALPLHLAKLEANEVLAALPEGLTLTSYGGAIPDPLRQRFQTLRPDIRLMETYATNEVGTVAVRRKDGETVVCPGAEVEIVDEDDHPITEGREGYVRVRKAGMAEDYIYDPAASAERFRGGWFYPGDIGVLESGNRFRVLGREDDLLNIGGLKITALTYERALTEIPEIQDACLLARPNGKGENELWIGLVSDTDNLIGSLAEKIKSALPVVAGDINLFILNQIPRTSSGKIRRRTVLQALEGKPDT